jgi:hypothetical protein
MKTRQGFVSNSSSSSFVIAKAYMTKEQITGLREGLKKIRTSGDVSFNEEHGEDEDYDNKEESWGESGRTWEETSHYFRVETYYVYRQINNLMDKLGLQDTPSIQIEG